MIDNKYILSKNAIGILLLAFGPPLFYFFRSQLHLGGGSFTSGLFYILSLFLIITPLHPKIGYRPNLILSQTGGLFFLLLILYFLIFNKDPSYRVLDSINISVIFLFFLLLTRVDNCVQKFLPFWTIVLTFIINLILIYSVVSNPNYAIGLRATVQFGDQEFTGNPGIYARNGLIGVTISLLFLFKQEEKLYQQESIYAFILTLVNLLLSISTIILTQTRMVLLSMIVILFAFVFLVKKNNGNRFPFNKKYVFLGLISSMYFINLKYQVIKLLEYYINSYWTMFERAIMTGLTLGKTSKTEIDASAMGRVDNINFFYEMMKFEKYNFIIGSGWRYRYIDIPVLEVFINFGIIAVILFLVFLILLIYFSLKSFKSTSIFQNFMGLFNISVMLGMLSAGRPTDLAYWLIFAIFIRFFGINEKSEEYPKKNVDINL
jgi:hypothetical protein